MRNLIIIGARGYGREVYDLATQCVGFNTKWTIKGFLDDLNNALKNYNYPVGILNSVEEYIPEENDVFICALGSVASKKQYIKLILEKGGEFINLIHPTVLINSNTTLGTGILAFPYANISNDCTVEDFVTIQAYVGIGHDCIIGKWSHINAFTFLGGAVILKECVTVNSNATILPKIVVNKDAIVGAGSVVIKNVKPETTVFGNPAKTLNF